MRKNKKEWYHSIVKRMYCKENMSSLSSELREGAYKQGTPRELLISDVIGAVIEKKRSSKFFYRNITTYSLFNK